MSKLICTLFSIVFVSSVCSQVNQGAILLGGDISFFTNEIEYPTGKKSEEQQVQFSPSIGTAIKNNLILGIDVTYLSTEVENESAGIMDELNDIGGGIFIRQYKPISNSFLVFGQGRAGYVSSEREYGNLANPTLRTTREASKINLSFMPGIAYKAGKRIFLEMSLSNLFRLEFEDAETTVSSSGTPQVTKQNTFRLSSSAGTIPLNIGMRLLFSK